MPDLAELSTTDLNVQAPLNNMKKIFILLLILSHFGNLGLIAQTDYRNGDLLFQDLDCGALCDAIESVTEGVDGRDFSHVGMVYRMYDTVFVIEAYGKSVQLIPLHTFLSRSNKPALHARLIDTFQQLIPPAIEFALQQIGVPYDEAFLFNNGKYYCSELIYDAFLTANHYGEIFERESMHFYSTDTVYKIWTEYYQKLDMQVPEGEPGINPGSLSRSKKLILLH